MWKNWKLGKKQTLKLTDFPISIKGTIQQLFEKLLTSKLVRRDGQVQTP